MPHQQYTPHSPSSSYQTMNMQMLDSYWIQEPVHAQSYPTDVSGNTNNQYDYTNISGDLFQPEEIFQLDQPLRPEFAQNCNTDLARSPPTLLDLGSGTIHREYKNEDYWNQNLSTIMNDDSNNSSCSRFNLTGSPDASQTTLPSSNIPVPHHDINYIGMHKSPPHSHFHQDNYDEFYKNSTNVLETAGESKLFYSEENLHNFDCFIDTKQVYRGYNLDGKLQEKCTDPPQFVDYSTLFYDNKGYSDTSTMNDFDFRFSNNYLPLHNIHCSPNFINVNNMSHQENV